MYQPVDYIEVHCWGKKVGALALDPESGYYAFEYYPDFAHTGIELAPLATPLARRGAQIYPNLSEETYRRLPAFVADALPDAFGNHLIDAWMASQGARPTQLTALDRLGYMGKRGMGALEFYPSTRLGSDQSTALELGRLVEEVRKALLVDFSGEPASDLDAELAQLISIGTSAGGARAKAVVGYNPQTSELISGQFDIPNGFEHWLIKFDVPSQKDPTRSQEYGRVEYAYYEMARACGINISSSRLEERGGLAHFMTRRFDREDDNTRHHVQTLCAMAEMDYNALRVHEYSQLFATAYELDLPYEAYDELFRRMVFNVAFSNNDDHTKNFGFMLKEGGSWQLAPAYDVTHARGIGPDAWTTQHIMGINGVFSDVTREDLLRAVERFHVANPEGIIDTALDVAASWPEFAERAGLSKAKTEHVGKDIQACAKLLRK